MSVAASVTSGLQAALLLARGRPEGLRFVRPDLAGAAQSFIAPAICFPAFVCLRLLVWTETGVPENAWHSFAIDFLCYVIGWVGYAVLSRPAVTLLGREQQWPQYISAWNWSNVVQYSLLVLGALPGLLGAPDWLAQTCDLVALGWALWLEWFVARVALSLPVIQAAGLVLLDMGLGLVLAALTGSGT